MSLETLRQAVQARKSDQFDDGTVIRWSMLYEVSGTLYTYVAVKTPVGWVTTSRGNGGTVPMRATFAKLLEILAMPESRNVAVSATWTPIDGGRDTFVQLPDLDAVISLDDLVATFKESWGAGTKGTRTQSGILAVLKALGYGS